LMPRPCLAWLVGWHDQLEGIETTFGLWREPDCPEELEIVYAPSRLEACLVRDGEGWMRKAIRYPDADHFAALADRPRIERRWRPHHELGWTFDDERRCIDCDRSPFGNPDPFFAVCPDDGLCYSCRGGPCPECESGEGGPEL